jgi:Flp pilus assembly protein CpaB
MFQARHQADQPIRRAAAAGQPSNGARPLASRRFLPGGRAVVGGFLVAVAAVATFAAYLGATTTHTVRYVVARQALRVGQRLVPSDLATEPMQLPASVADGLAFRSPAALVGAVVVGPVRPGELVQAGDVSLAPRGTPGRQLSFSVPLSHAVDGDLEPGDRVDVVATYGTGTDSSTEMVASGVEVVAVAQPSSATAANGEPAVVVTLAVTDVSEAVALAQAANAAQVTLVLSTGASIPRSLPSAAPPSQSIAGAGGAPGAG